MNFLAIFKMRIVHFAETSGTCAKNFIRHLEIGDDFQAQLGTWTARATQSPFFVAKRILNIANFTKKKIRIKIKKKKNF